MRPVIRCTVLLEYEIVTGYFLDARQQLLLQQYITIIVGKVSNVKYYTKRLLIYHSEQKLNDLDYSISYKSNVVQLYT